MHLLVVHGTVKTGEETAFLAAADDYNAARRAAGVPAYRRFVRTGGAGGDEYLFVAEFDSEAAFDQAEELIDAGTFSGPLAKMYEHLVEGSVRAELLREV